MGRQHLGRFARACAATAVAVAALVGVGGAPAGALDSGSATVTVTIDAGTAGLSGGYIGLCAPGNSCAYVPVAESAPGMWSADFAVPPGDYVAGFSTQFYSDGRDFQSYVIDANLHLVDGANPTVVSVPPTGGTISGTVNDANGAALPVGVVEVTSTNPHPQPFEFSGLFNWHFSGGTFTLPGITTGEYKVFIRSDAPGAGAAVESIVSVTAPATTTVNQQLVPGGSVAGVVTDPDGNPVAGATVWATQPGMAVGSYAYAITEANGSYHVGDVVPQSGYRLTVGGPMFQNDWAYDAQSATVSLNAVSTVNFALYHGARLTGHVTDGNGAPVEGAYVTLTSGSSAYGSSTDANGAYTVGDLAGVPTGTYTVTAEKQGQPTTSVTGIALVAGQSAVVDLQMLVPGAKVSGTVTDSNGAPLAGATVSLVNPSLNAGWGMSTDSNGHYVFEGLPDGSYDIEVNAAGFAPASAPGVALADGSPVVQNFTLPGGGILSGHVTDTDGFAIVGANVFVSGPDGPRFTTTDGAGGYSVDTLASGSYTLDVSASGYSSAQVTAIPVVAGSTTNQDATLQRVGALHVTVRDSAGTLYPSATVYASPHGDNFNVTYASNNNDGTYDLSGLAPGNYDVYASAPGNPSAGFTAVAELVGVVGGSTTSVDLQLQPGGALEGIVTDANGAAVVGATILVRDGLNQFAGSTSTGVGGTYSVPSLAPGTYTVVVQPNSPTLASVASGPVVIAAGPATVVNVTVPLAGTIGATFSSTGTGPFAYSGFAICPGTADPSVLFGCTGWRSGPPSIGGLAPGQYTVVGLSLDSNFGVVETSPLVTVNLAGGETLDCTLVTTPDGISGSASCAAGAPSANVNGHVTGALGSLAAAIACPGTTDPDPAWAGGSAATACPGGVFVSVNTTSGDFAFAGLTPGAYRFRAYSLVSGVIVPGTALATTLAGGVNTVNLVIPPPNVASVPSSGGGDPIVLQSPANTLISGVTATPVDPGSLPPGATAASDVLGFTVSGVGNGGTADVTVTLPVGSTPNRYYKIRNSTLVDFTDHVTITGNVVVLHLQDGDAFDTDGRPGVIGDPGFAADADVTGPVVECPATPTFLLRQPGATVTADVSDADSGVASPTVTVNADTATVGARAVDVTATDVAGNSTTQSCAYAVHYRFVGFGPLVGNDVLNTMKAGKSAPLTWWLGDAAYKPVSSASTFVSVTATTVACPALSTAPVLLPTSGSGFKSLGLGAYLDEWKSSTSDVGKCKALTVTLADGTTHSLTFKLK